MAAIQPCIQPYEMIFQLASNLSGGVRSHIAYTTSTQALSGSRGQQGEPGGRAAPPACDPAHAPALASKHPAGTPPRRRRAAAAAAEAAAAARRGKSARAREEAGGRPAGKEQSRAGGTKEPDSGGGTGAQHPAGAPARACPRRSLPPHRAQTARASVPSRAFATTPACCCCCTSCLGRKAGRQLTPDPQQAADSRHPLHLLTPPPQAAESAGGARLGRRLRVVIITGFRLRCPAPPRAATCVRSR